jgi:hypothetical protein
MSKDKKTKVTIRPSSEPKKRSDTIPVRKTSTTKTN